MEEIDCPIRMFCCGGVYCERHLNEILFTDLCAKSGCPLCRRTLRPILKFHDDAFDRTRSPVSSQVTATFDGNDQSFDLSVRCVRRIMNCRARAFQKVQDVVDLILDRHLDSEHDSVSFEEYVDAIADAKRHARCYSSEIVQAVKDYVEMRYPFSRRSRIQAALVLFSENVNVECIHDEITDTRLAFLMYWFCVGNWAIKRRAGTLAEIKINVKIGLTQEFVAVVIDADGILTISSEGEAMEIRRPPLYTTQFNCLD